MKERLVLAGEIPASDVKEGDVLRRRHRNNPAGFWVELRSLAERRVNVDQVAVSRDGEWFLVVFPNGGWRQGGRPEGSKDKTSRKSKTKKKV